MRRLIFGIHAAYETIICECDEKTEHVQLFTGSKRNFHWDKSGYIRRDSNLLSARSHCSLQLQPTRSFSAPRSMWSEQGWVWSSVESRRASSPLLSGASVSPATVLSNKPAPSTGRASCLKAPSPNIPVTLKTKKKRGFSSYAASLYAIISLSDPCFVLN